MYILLTGKPPFNGDSDEEILKKILQNHLDLEIYPWSVISLKAKDLIKKLLETDTKKRITAEEALNHEWFKCKQVNTQETSGLFKVKNPDLLLNNLINYRTDNPLRCAVLAYLIHNNMQLEHVHEAIKLFNNIDLNGDGQISKEELYLGLKDFLELSGDKLKNNVDIIFNYLDTDHNGFIEYEEFIRAAVNKKIFFSTNYLRFAFDYFDRDKNGSITFNEIKNIFFINEKNKKDSKAQEQLLKCFKETDTNGNGNLTFDEFIKMTKNIIEE
jgi:calcium-dependent protein kinase